MKVFRSFNMVPLFMTVAVLLLSLNRASLYSETAKFLQYPDLFEVLGKANPFVKHEITFAVKQLNIDVLQSILLSVSNISNPLYGQHLSRDEVALITSNPASTEYVRNYLHERGISNLRTTKHGEYIIASASIFQWEEMFETVFYSLKNLAKGSTSYSHQHTSVRASRFSTPNDLLPHLLAVFNIIETPSFQRQRTTVSGEALSKQNIVAALTDNRQTDQPRNDKKKAYTGFTYPGLINQYYNISSNTGSQEASQAVFETSGQTFSSVDMAIFENVFSLPTAQPNDDINGHITTKACMGVDNCAEANLDVQYLMAIAQNVSTTFWYSGESASSAFTDWLVEVANVALPPQVISISYSIAEQFLSYFEVQIFDIEAMKLLVQGVTLLAAAGDSGVTGDGYGYSSCGYNPVFPASSIYVTAVGGTQGPELGRDEVACQSDRGSSFTTGGGFSNIYSRPSWQDKSHDEYFASVSHDLPYINASIGSTGYFPFARYNRMGRGYPDISVIGVKYIVAINGSFYPVDGTSAACPVAAAIVSLINSERIKAGKPSIGWLNPTLYSSSLEGLTKDVTIGANKCLKVGEKCCMQGFKASKGWDPVTGWGTIDFYKFKRFFLKMKIKPLKRKEIISGTWIHWFLGLNLFYLQLVFFSLTIFCCVGCYFRTKKIPEPSNRDSYIFIASHYDEIQ